VNGKKKRKGREKEEEEVIDRYGGEGHPKQGRKWPPNTG
jgi:hypothetical protein